MEPRTNPAWARPAPGPERHGSVVREAWRAARSGRGATAVEYAILLAGITAAIVLAATQLGTGVASLFGKLHWP